MAVGDVGRVWLHAKELRFLAPDGTEHQVAAPLPADLEGSLAALGEPLRGAV